MGILLHVKVKNISNSCFNIGISIETHQLRYLVEYAIKK